jgi:hypothetical protein
MCEPEPDNKKLADDSALDSSGGPTLVYTLEEDVNRKEQLASFRDESSEARRKTALHRQNEQQLLEEGKLAQSEFSARLQRVTLGLFRASRPVAFCFSSIFVPEIEAGFAFARRR